MTVHLVEPGARVTLCGRSQRGWPATPYRSHRAPRRGDECPACLEARPRWIDDYEAHLRTGRPYGTPEPAG